MKRALARRTDAAVDNYLSGTLADLTMVQERAWPAAMAGDLPASEVVMRAIEQRLRVFGQKSASRSH